jgi:hypothetical protein
MEKPTAAGVFCKKNGRTERTSIGEIVQESRPDFSNSYGKLKKHLSCKIFFFANAIFRSYICKKFF